MNLLIACDSSYYSTWAINCINSVKKFTPWLDITVIVVNPNNLKEISNVRYVYDYIDFTNEDSKVAYYQAVRFTKCADLFPNNELVMSIDCDTILTKSFTQNEFLNVCKSIHVQRHQKADRWMAGLVTYGSTNDFRLEFKNQLLSKPVETWEYGWDQKILNMLSTKYNYTRLEVGNWMSFGKGNGTFLTLKGDQKTSPKHLNSYKTKLGDLYDQA
jgi:hypothetical protein